jgi:hypothetical protein
MIIKMIALIILIEALTELTFKAAPLQPLRAWLIRNTPTLRSKAQGHLLDCKYCTSIWIGAVVIITNYFISIQALNLLAAVIIFSRLANFLHVIFALLRDTQINLRLTR